jgi:hypothetical protein
MTKKANKLTLARETIAPLQPEQLDTVVGGIGIKVTVGQTCCLFNSCNKTKAVAE